jgi:hypothetical protein
MRRDIRRIAINPKPMKRGHEWYIEAKHPSGQREHISGFKTESDAYAWIAGAKSKEWLKKRGYGDE